MAPLRITSLLTLVLLCFLQCFAMTATAAGNYQLHTLNAELSHPWSLAFLPDGDFLITERGGKLLRLSADGKTRSEIQHGPETYVAGQGGYFDIVLDPQFNSNRLVYLSFAQGSPEANGLAVIRAKLEGDTLLDSQQIFRCKQDKDTPQHYGGRLLFTADGHLLISTGDGFDYREQAQNPDSELGKVIRINSDGSVPSDNPFAAKSRERIFSSGHRNPQGLALDGESGAVYLHEHGPRGGDEVNLLLAGNNYGWPAVTYGLDYSGALVSPFQSAPGMTAPLKYWVPSIAPSGMAWYGGNIFPDWRGSLFVGALVDQEVRRLELKNGEIVAEEALFSEITERIRDVRVGPDGNIYLLTDSPEGRLIRVQAPEQ